jgi:hypothetical protein
MRLTYTESQGLPVSVLQQVAPQAGLAVRASQHGITLAGMPLRMWRPPAQLVDAALSLSSRHLSLGRHTSALTT